MASRGADHQPQRGQRQHRDGRAGHGHDGGQHEQGCAHALDGGPPLCVRLAGVLVVTV
jgi:hypothetical protein